MNKKFLSAILFGALMITSTGTFVSCKDYDDDINDLQTQIDNLATKSDVEAKLSQLQTAISAAQAQATEALAAAKAADNSAEIAALEAKIAAFKSCSCDVEAMLAEIKAATDAQMADYKKQIEELIATAEGLVGKVAEYVTDVELVVSETKGETFPKLLDFYTITEKGNVFEENIAGAITFVEGKETQIAKDPILVRVSPANAVLEDDMISLVNSKGENIDEYVDITVAKYNGLLSAFVQKPEAQSRAAANSGLWEVTVKLKNKAAFEKISVLPETSDNAGESILYALQVNNTMSNAEARYVTSSYDVVLNTWAPFTPASELLFTVDGVSVAEINNRYDATSESLIDQTTGTKMYNELTWAASTVKNPTPAVEATKDNVKTDEGDLRSDKPVALAVQGKPLTIAIDKDIADKVAAIYVTLDKEANAIESAPSEWNAWKKYSYTGLNQVVDGTSTTITINGEETINDYIGFRVYAVNKDGSLVDPDGKAFYVLVGDQAQELKVAATTITPESEVFEGVKSKEVAVEGLDKITGAAKWSWSVTGEGNQPFYLALANNKGAAVKYDGTNDAIFKLVDGTEGSIPAAMDWTKVKSVYTLPAQDWYLYEDGKTYTGVFTLYTESGHVLAKLNVSFTKVLPTAAPEGFSIKTNQVVDGIYNCYLVPMKDGVETWTAKGANQGSMAMDQIFNIPAKLATNFTINFATSDKDKDGKYTVTIPVAGNETLKVGAALIDNTTKHATTATYNYGVISSAVYAAAKKANKAEGDAAYNYVVTLPEVNFETVYNCIYNDTYSWTWATREQLAKRTSDWLEKNTDGSYKLEVPTLTLTYGTPFSLKNIEKYIYGVSAWDSKYNAFLDKAYGKSLSIESATFTSDANSKEEYFKPAVDVENNVITSLEVLPETSNPVADVASTLTIKVKDMYGHDRVITIPAVVKPRKE